jgi:DNA-binding MarR family transcriptional regulator
MNPMAAKPASPRRTASPPPAEWAPRGCTSFKLRQITRRVGRYYDEQVAAAGLKTTQYSLLSHLATLGAVRPSELAARMGLEPSTLTRNLQPLVAAGWVEMAPGVDARSRLVGLTDAGRDKRTEAQRAWKRAQLEMNGRLGVERVARLHALIEECMTVLDAVDEGVVAEGDSDD